MTALPPIDQDHLMGVLEDLLNIPSPTGRADPAIERVAAEFAAMGIPTSPTLKGGLLAICEGRFEDAPRAMTVHVDTLGAMVKEIKANGRLRLSKVGGFSWNAVEGEGCSVFTATGRPIRGTILIRKASLHVYGGELDELKRDDENMEVRLDARTSSPEDTLGLGVRVGDYVAFDPRVERGDQGFIRSRHLDDKAGVACLLSALRATTQAGLQPAQRTTLHISNYEEVGHGAASLPADLSELIAIDMAAVGEGQASDEFHATICLKDSGGPYHAGLSDRLRALAEAHEIPYRLDLYPHYGSDGEAYWKAGADAQVALFGPGVDASHNYERTHVEALLATARLALAYLIS